MRSPSPASVRSVPVVNDNATRRRSAMTSSSVFGNVISVVKCAVIFGVLLNANRCSGQRCKIPKEWRGRYYQSGIGETFVRETRITTKGSCIDHSGDFFLFHNRENRCYHCLQILRRHRNLLQYRESYCSSPGTIESVCAHIRPHSAFNMLIREPAEPIPCSPAFGVDDGYSFDYNDQTYGFCSRSSSYASPCVNRTTQRLSFNHCVALATYSGRELYMECLAAWTDDSESFLFAKLIGFDKENAPNDEDYRCFKYTRHENQLFMAMSVDSTCRGLRSSKDGQFVMELVRDTFGWPSPACAFPEWLNGPGWRDISGKWRYSIGDGGRQTIQVRHQAGVSTQPLVDSLYRCIDTLDYYTIDEEYIFLSFSTHGCDSKRQCLKIRRRSQFVVEFYAGSFMDHWTRGRCVTETDYTAMTPLIAEAGSARPVRCPYVGIYYMTGPAGGCVYRLDVGCHNSSAVYVESAAVCTGHTSSASFPSRFVTLECRVTWSVGSMAHLIARDQLNDRFMCFHFVNEDGGVLTLIKDDDCNLRTNKIQTRHSSFSVLRRDNCPLPKVTEPINGRGHQLDVDLPSFQTPTDRYRTPYQHHPEQFEQRPYQHGGSDGTVDYTRYNQHGGRASDHSPAKISSDYYDDEEEGASSGDGNSIVRGRHGRRQDGSRSVAVSATAYQVVERSGLDPLKLDSSRGGSYPVIDERLATKSSAVVGVQSARQLFPVTLMSSVVTVVIRLRTNRRVDVDY